MNSSTILTLKGEDLGDSHPRSVRGRGRTCRGSWVARVTMKGGVYGFGGEDHAPMCTTLDSQHAARLLSRRSITADVVVIVGGHIA